jgi:hypothetical protein
VRAELDIPSHSIRYWVLLLIVALLLAGCGSVQIFDSFGEDETQAPAAPTGRCPQRPHESFLLRTRIATPST